MYGAEIGVSSVARGAACPRNTTSTICLRSKACERASRSFGSSSSRFFFFLGFELKPKSRISLPWPVTSWMSPYLPSLSATVNGTSSM